jgi:hypothetical protein
VSLDLSPLRQIPVLRTVLKVYYRHVWLPPDGSAPDPLFVRREGRWRTDWTLYTATSPPVAWAEYCRNHARDVAAADPTGGVGLDDAGLAALGPLELGVPARALFAFELAFDNLADLTSEWATDLLTRSGFSIESFTADAPNYGDCPDLAGLAATLNWQAMLVPSAAWPSLDGLCVPVFDRDIPALDTPREVLTAARPSVAVAAATSYALGARPRWLA